MKGIDDTDKKSKEFVQRTKSEKKNISKAIF